DLGNDYRKYQSGDDLVSKKVLIPITGEVLLARIVKDFWSARDCFLQEITIPNRLKNAYGLKNKSIDGPRVITLFMPNTLNVHLDTNGAWPFGRRPNDNMGNKFTA